jgi:pyruvate ferredoxin oxidoreductase alpha subunit
MLAGMLAGGNQDGGGGTMIGRRGIEVSLAVAEAAKLCRVEVISAYPITPQTHIVEHLSELVADGELEANYITVESEHSAMSACVGASATGARTFTSTSSQGLELMHEVLFIASGMRLPIVMATANRALSAPLNIWNDHSDVMAARDSGWIMLFCTNGQEAFDTIIMAYRIAEDRRVLTPLMVNIDGFTLTHVVEPVEFPSQETVDAFLPSYEPVYTLHPDKPVTMGGYGLPDIYTECKFAQETAMVQSKEVIIEVMDAFGKHFGRPYHAVETYKLQDADVVFIALGAINENIMTSIDEMRTEGKKAGLVNLRLYRPFPGEEMLAALDGKKRVAVIERAMPGGALNSPLFNEITSLAYRSGLDAVIKNYVIALGGRDALQGDFRHIFEDMQKASAKDTRLQTGLNFEMIGVRA